MLSLALIIRDGKPQWLLYAHNIHRIAVIISLFIILFLGYILSFIAAKIPALAFLIDVFAYVLPFFMFTVSITLAVISLVFFVIGLWFFDMPPSGKEVVERFPRGQYFLSVIYGFFPTMASVFLILSFAATPRTFLRYSILLTLSMYMLGLMRLGLNYCKHSAFLRQLRRH